MVTESDELDAEGYFRSMISQLHAWIDQNLLVDTDN